MYNKHETEVIFIGHSTWKGESALMDDKYKTKEQLIKELKKLHQRTADLEKFKKQVNVDITDRKKAEEALRQSENKYRLLIENLPQKIFYKDRDSVYVSCNENYARDLKIRPEEIVGKTDYDFYPRELAEKYRADDKRIMELGNIENIEERYIQNGHDVWVHTVKTPIKDEKGNADGILGIFWDITERKKMEAVLRKAHGELEMQVKKRTAELLKTNEELLIEIAERERMEEALRESEKKYRNLYDAAPDMYHTLNKNGIIIDCNETEARMLGYKKEEIIGRPVTDFFTEESKRFFEEDFPRLNKENKLLNIEREFIRKDGTIFPAMLNVFSEYDENGEFVKANTISRDITILKQAENALRDSEKKYRNLVDNALVGIYKTNLKGDILYTNKALLKMLGFDSLEEMISVNVMTTYKNPDDREVLIESLKNTGRISNFETELITKTGKPKNIILNAILEGDIISGMMMDISERKKAEKVLLESEERYKRLLESVTDYVYTVEIKEGRPVRTLHGPGCKAVTGYDPEEFAADPYLWYQMVYDEDKEAVARQAERMLSGKSVSPLEHRIFHKNGFIRWVRNSTVARYDDNGHIIAYDGLISDITERKRLEEQLLHAQKMEAVGQLAGGIAHDFNNILTAIIGFGNLLKMDISKDVPSRTYVTQILNSAERAANLTQALLAFSRKQIINLRPANLNEIINVLEKLLSRLIGEDIELSTFLADEDLTVMADSSQIEQVLMNLATNARDAMPDGGSLIIRTGLVEFDYEFIKAHGFGRPGFYAIISVEDTGQGMDERTRERIFEPFFTTKEVGKGTGLGLSMVYGIIKQHEGYINAYSEPEKGTTFKIYLPLIKSKAVEVMEEGLPPIKRGTETLLVAEDDTQVRELTRELLEGFGYKVLEAADGEEAIKIFNENKDNIHLLILDVIMPRKSGKEVHDEIKKVRPDIKAIFISGYTSDIIYKKGILKEGLDIILKPISLDELLIKVREVLDK